MDEVVDFNSNTNKKPILLESLFVGAVVFLILAVIVVYIKRDNSLIPIMNSSDSNSVPVSDSDN